jgi:hypothetical protein
MTIDMFAPGNTRSAVISTCGRYRYRLDRSFGTGGRVCWVMLNPSTADGETDDPTLRRCTTFTRIWGHGSLTVVNLFAWRATDPKDIPDSPDAVGPEADKHIADALDGAAKVVCGWGGSLSYRRRSSREIAVLKLIEDLGHVPLALDVTNSGAPKHPLYLRADLTPRPLAELRQRDQ